MKNITGKNKWTKKLKAVVISLALIFAVALGGACAAIGLSVADRNQRPGYLAGSTAGTSDLEPEETFAVDGDTYKTNAQAWEAAVEYSVSHNNALVQFNLEKTWTANATTGFGTATETNSPYGAAGSLNVPSGASIILNISEKVRLNRNVGATAIANGNVIDVSGTLIIQGDGVITGGNYAEDTFGGGGLIMRDGSTVELYGGKITGNKAARGAGIYAYGGSTLNIKGGAINGNTVAGGSAGGIVILENATLNMTGGEVNNNTSGTYGGAMHILGTANISGGTISGNTSLRGGGITVNGANAIVTVSGDTVISKNTATGNGGGVFVNVGTFKLSSGKISNNTASGNGGGVFVNENVNYFNMSGGEISGNTAKNGGGIICYSPVNFLGGEVFGNTASVHGGGIYSDNTLYLGSEMEECEGKIYNNTAVNGGGIYLEDGTCKIYGGEIYSNTATESGGGIYNFRTEFTMNGGTISGNTAKTAADTQGGGGIYVAANSTFAMHGGTISDNETLACGGGILLGANTDENNFIIDEENGEVLIENNKAGLNGGGIYMMGIVTINAGAISGNTSNTSTATEKSYGGGGIYITSKTILKMNGGEISGNNAKVGGGIYATGTFTMNGGTIDGNTANGDDSSALPISGGGVYVATNGTFTMTDGVISGNNATERGGGIGTYAGAIEITGGTISDNTTVSGGGGVYSGATLLTVKNCKISNNKGASGGICKYQGTLNVSDCEISGNIASMNGGGIYVGGGTATILKTSFTKNSAERGGGIFVNSSTCTVGNDSGGGCKIGANIDDAEPVAELGNKAYDGGGVYVNSGTFKAINSRVWSNSATNGGGIYVGGGTAFIQSTTVSDNTALNDGGGIYHAGTLTVSRTTVIKDNTSGNLTNNLYITKNGAAIRKFDSSASFSTASRIGISAEIPGTFYTNTNGHVTTDDYFFADNTNLYSITKSSTNYNITLKTQTQTLAQRWVTAVTTSSTGNPKLFEMTENWTAAANGNGFGTDSSAFMGGSLFVPSGKEVILDLKGYTLNRSNYGRVIVVNGKLTIKGVGTITGGKTTGNGGAIAVSLGELILNGGTITDNSTTSGYSGGGVYVFGNGKFTMNGGTISNNTTPSSGSGVCVNENSSFTMNGGTISGNTATGNGGGVWMGEGCTFEMNGGTISGNTANPYGGGVYVSANGTFEMNGGTISGNSASNGAGVMCYGSFTMNGGTISGNEATNGGGIYGTQSSTIKLMAGTITNNYAANGAGVYLTAPTLYMGEKAEDGTLSGTAVISNNRYSTEGGGFYLNTNTTLKIYGGTIKGNYVVKATAKTTKATPASTNLGGGIYATTGTTIEIEGGTISGNEAYSGGGIFVTGANAALNLKGGTISGNTSNSTVATDGGGGIYVNSSCTLNIYSGTISGNTAVRGGGIYSRGNINIEGGKISGNTASMYGGGLLMGTSFSMTITGGEISGNKCTGSGGGIYVPNGDFELSGTAKICDNTANNGGGVIIDASTVFTMSGGVISNNTATTNGGGVHIQSGGTFNMNSGEISGNTATKNGGGVYASGSFTMEGGTISGNTSQQDEATKGTVGGGGVYVAEGNTVNLNGGVISGNTAYRGGGVYNNGTLSIDGVEISSNIGKSYGGGIYAKTGITISSGKISDNESGIDGGGVLLGSTTTSSMSGGTISGNTAVRGGGIYVPAGLTFTITGGVIDGNTAQYGGGVFNYGTLNVSAVMISNNIATVNGGGIGSDGKVTISGTAKISDNSATDNGGGICMGSGTTLEVGGGEISGNTAGYGAGIYLSTNATLTLNSGTISDNTSNLVGGGIACSVGTLNMKGGTISGNSAGTFGGGIYFASNTPKMTISGGMISGNEATSGGGVYIEAGTGEMSAGTISGNTANGGNGGGVYVSLNGTFIMTGGTIGGETAEEGNCAKEGAGGGIHNNGTLTVGGATFENNYAVSGGAVCGNHTMTISNSLFKGNSAGSYGGAMSVVDVTLQDVIVNNNTAGISGGGIYGNGAVKVSGKIVITDNTVDGKLNNVYLVTDKKLTISAALNSAAKIGVTAEGTLPITVTSGFSGKTGHNADLVRNVFKADKKGQVAILQSNEVTLVQGRILTVKDTDGNEIDAITTVAGATVTGTFTEATKIYKLQETGAAANVVNADLSEVVPDGYVGFMYLETDPTKTPINSVTMSEDLSVVVGIKAVEKDYTIKYILQNTDGTYNTSTFIKAVRSGVTDTPVVVMDTNGQPFATIPNASEYTLDTSYDNGKNVTVGGDGKTEVLVYLKLNEYTVTYNATGATPSKQTKKMRYGATVVAPARTPSKAMSTFVGWTDASGNLINFATTTLTVQGNMTLTAKFDMETFNVYFNLNIDGYDESISLPSNSELVVPTVAGLEDIDYLVTWDYEKLFPAANGFNFRAYEDNYGTFIIDYTIDNIPNTMSIKSVKPTAVGYTFDGWYINDTLVTTIQRPNVNTDKFLELTAHWSPASYTMRFDKQDGSWNSVSSTTVTNMSLISDILPDEPTRAGYIFGGWYITPSTDESNRHTQIDLNAYVNPNDGKKYFSIAKIADLYGNEEDGYNFSGLTLYAEWTSEDIYVLYTGDEYVSLEFKNADNHNGSIGVKAQAMHVSDVVTVKATAQNGYKFINLIVNNRPQPEGVTEFTIRDTYLSEYEYNGNTYKVIRVSATYSEESYVINYDVDGGTSTSTNFARTYTPSQLLPTSPNRAKLSSRLTKQGYDFMGWELTSNHELAFTLDAGVDGTKDLFGQNLWMATPTKEDGITPDYREVWLKAIWKPQPAKVNLYNATYNNLYEGSDEDGYVIEDYRAEGAVSAKKLETAMDIKIVNPVREAFDFLGWATSRNGAVVYPVVEGVNTIDYKVNADHDINGNALNRNNLYAVWHIKGVDRINMTVTNNGCTYGGSGITMSAKPAQSYEVADGATINLTYTWYRVFDGMYDDCFTTGKVFVNNGKVTGYEFNGKYYEADGKTEVATKPAGEEFEYKRFDTNSVGKGCELKYTQTRTPSQTSTLNIRNVIDCGTYICVVEVEATVGGDSTTRAGGYGEIEISMDKAVYGNLVLENATKAYNGKVQTSAVRLALAKSDNATLAQGDDGVWYLSLPDHRLNAGGTRLPDTNSKVIVTYSYYVEDGNARREITDLNEIKNVGKYYVVVSFAFTPDGDKGNYEALEPIEAELVITPFEISKIGYTFVHGDEKSTTTFSGAYDGVAYSVEAAINSRFGLEGTGDLVTDVDDVKLAVVVNAVTENGDDELSEAELPTIEAGVYSVVITGLTGNAAGNYVLKSSATLRKEYTITKNVYEVSGKIKFEDKTEVFDHTLKTLEIEWEGEWPTTVTPRYRVVSYEQEDGQFTKNDHLEDNFNELGNAGRYAGIYTIEVTFEDSESDNYEALESMTAELTITKANIFDYMRVAHGEDLLTAAGFVSGSYSFNANKSYLPVIEESVDCRLNDKDNFKITYSYYSVDETTGDRTSLDKNGDGVIQANEKIFEPGKYDIVANIEYVSALYRNNFEEIQESESTITYVIRNVDVESVTVTFTDEFEASGRVAKYGEGFSYSWIEQIDVAYVDKDNNNERSVRHITSEADIALSLITLERNDSIFWHVGEFKVKVGMYETNSDEYVLNVKQEISQVEVQYSKNEGAYVTVGEDGIELEEGAQYEFQIIYSGVNINGTNVNGMLSSVEAPSTLKLGKNVLTADVANYIFTEEIAVDMYKVINKDVTELTWQYSRDGGSSWTDLTENEDGGFTLPYIGTEYLIRVTFEDDGQTQACLAKAESGLAVLNYRRNGYYMQVGRSGNYKIDAHCSIAISQRVIEVDWSDENKAFTYNGLHQSPEVTSDNLTLTDKGKVTFGYQLEDEDGNALGEHDVIGAGTYVIKVVLTSEDGTANNYTVVGSETAKHTFEIEKAEVAMSVTYSESNYGPNVTYANNEHGLRLNAIKPTFENGTVEGRFAFIKYGNDGTYTEIAGNDEWIKTQLTGTPDHAEIDYAFIPDDENYKVTTGQLSLNVKGQTYKTGTGALLIELGEGATHFYLVGGTFNTEDINVYRVYQSYYTEGDQWYGFRGNAIKNANLRINNEQAEGRVIKEEDVSGGMITLTAISGTNTGTIEIPVIEKEAVKLEITSKGYRTVYYIGETYDFGDLEFKVTFEDDTDQSGLKKGTVRCDFDGKEFDTTGEKVITFSLFGATCELKVEVKGKENLQIVEFTTSEKTLIWTGEALTAPALKFSIDGTTYTEYDGIKVTCRVMQGQQEVSLKNEGTYSVYYTITVTNPRFNRIATPKLFAMEVTKNPYRLTITTPAEGELSATYTGSNIEIPKPEIGDIIDTRTNEVVAPDSVSYTINGVELTKEEVTKPWNRLNAGTYVVEVVVAIDGREFSETYTFAIAKATNGGMAITTDTVVLGDEANFRFPVTANFGASTVTYTYSQSRNGEYTAELPNEAGDWYVKATIAGTDNYTGLEIIEPFKVRDNSANATVGEGSISGGDGIGKDWTLEINRMEAEAVSQVSISKQDVHDGYEVVLKDEHGLKVEDIEKAYTVRIKLAEELSGRSDLKVFFKDADGNTREMKVDEIRDGYIQFKTSEFGTFIITSAHPKESVGLLVAVIVLGVVAAGMITACIIVFVKKKKKGEEQ